MVTKVKDRVPPSLLYKNIALRDTYETSIRRIVGSERYLCHLISLINIENATTYSHRCEKNTVSNSQTLIHIVNTTTQLCLP